MQDLARNVGKSHDPLFAPLLFGVAAQIEAIGVPEMARDGTRLRKNATDLRRMLGLSAVACAVPSLMELEVLGVPVDSEVWPPRLVKDAGFDLAGADVDPQALQSSARLAASIDMVRQCLAADGDEPVISVALTGPATLAAQLRAASPVGGDFAEEAIYDLAGRLLAALVRLYAEAGVHLVQFHESRAPVGAVDYWKGALGTAGNVARFHRIPPLLVYDHGVSDAVWPMQAVPCMAGPSEARPSRAHAHAWAGDPASWGALPEEGHNARVVTSAADVHIEYSLADLMEHVRRVHAAA
jgi:acetophenone carboxylase